MFGEDHAAIKTEDILVEPEASVDIRNDQVGGKFVQDSFGRLIRNSNTFRVLAYRITPLLVKGSQLLIAGR